MPKFFNKLLTVLLAIAIALPTFGIVEAKEANTIQDSLKQSDYIVLEKENSSYGEVYYVVPGSRLRQRSLWDLVDVVMAGASWADFFKDPSWSNLGWAVLDTASILPVLPSSAYIRKGGKVFLKVDEVAKFAKTSKGKTALKSAMKVFSYADGITSKAINKINKTFKNQKEAREVLELFKKAANKGLVGAQGQAGIKKINPSSKIGIKYTHEIKITNKQYADYRIFGYQTSEGGWIFDYFGRGLH